MARAPRQREVIALRIFLDLDTDIIARQLGIEAGTVRMHLSRGVTAQSGVQPTVTIDPAAMPAGTELSFGDFRLSTGQQQASFALIDTSSYTCTSTPPGPTGPPDGSQLLYGGPGPAGS
jgi:hypothetical protein